VRWGQEAPLGEGKWSRRGCDSEGRGADMWRYHIGVRWGGEAPLSKREWSESMRVNGHSGRE